MSAPAIMSARSLRLARVLSVNLAVILPLALLLVPVHPGRAAPAAPAAPAAAQANCAGTQTGMVPLNQLGAEGYQGFPGGLYPGGNQPPVAQAELALAAAARVRPRDRAGQPDPAGQVVLLSIGMSNASQEYQRFMSLTAAAPNVNPRLKLVDGAQGGQTASVIRNPAANFWTVVDQRLAQAGVGAAQVQAVWLKEANAQPRDAFPRHAQALADDIAAVIGILHSRFPNLQLVYLSSRIYAGYASTTLNPEPFAYEGAFSVRWLIERQIAGDAGLNADPAKGPVTSPVLLWGPYLWADGLTPRQGDGLTWACTDLVEDGTHPSDSGRSKVGNLLLDFLRQSPSSRPWFLADPNATPPPSATPGTPPPSPTAGTVRPTAVRPTPGASATAGAPASWRVHETPSGDELTVSSGDPTLLDRLRQLGSGRVAWLCGRVLADPSLEWGFTFAPQGMQLQRTPPVANQTTIRAISAAVAAAPQPACIQLDAARELTGEATPTAGTVTAGPTATATATVRTTEPALASPTVRPSAAVRLFLPQLKADYQLNLPPQTASPTSEGERPPPGPTRERRPTAEATSTAALPSPTDPVDPPANTPTPTPATADTVVAGVNLTQLFAPPSAAELQAVRSERAARQLPVVDGRILLDRPNADGTRTLVLSHRVAGEKHYGAVRLPSLAPGAQAPVILVLHGGKDGAKLDALDKMDRDYADLAATAVIVLPAYRGEAIAGTPLGDLLSEGDFGSPEDHADDALSLLNVVEAMLPEADTARTAVYGTSRGGGVALAVALRADPRVRAVFDLFGAADFFAPEVVTLMATALTAGRPPGPPGESTVYQQAVQPLAAGQLSVAEARRIILRWSPAQFAAAMSRPLQVHHGTADQSVPVGHSLRLAAAMAAIGRGAPDFRFFAYEGGGHGEVPGAEERIKPLLAQALAP